MRMPLAVAASLVIASGTGAGHAAPPAANPDAVAAVREYVSALRAPYATKAYSLLTISQQRYFGNVRNFASNYATTQYRVSTFAIKRVSQHKPDLVEVDVAQKVSYYDVADATIAGADVVEPYYALRNQDRWGVKEVYGPWKSYAPRASGRTNSFVVVVDRIEFFDHRVQLDCTLRNLGRKPLQVLPLLQSTLKIGSGRESAALNSANFPLNDRQFYEGARIYPFHQLVGYLNFALNSRVDTNLSATLVVGPAIEDGGNAPESASVGPMLLPKL